jgi:hypothetical protein
VSPEDTPPPVPPKDIPPPIPAKSARRSEPRFTLGDWIGVPTPESEDGVAQAYKPEDELEVHLKGADGKDVNGIAADSARRDTRDKT